MSEALTTEQATERYLCGECRERGNGACDFNCVESRTCSVRCQRCAERVWFQGNLSDQGQEFICPYCGGSQVNRHLGRRWR